MRARDRDTLQNRLSLHLNFPVHTEALVLFLLLFITIMRCSFPT